MSNIRQLSGKYLDGTITSKQYASGLRAQLSLLAAKTKKAKRTESDDVLWWVAEKLQ